ncbi:MAG: acetoacetate--CoA ligase [Beijerinckiaceae bacterium]|nr:acetoacetate--CoA ligase [Beijerinckiaceae bacterium]
MDASSSPLWSPQDLSRKNTGIQRFMTYYTEVSGRQCTDFKTLHQASIDDRGLFWSSIWDFFKVIGDKGERSLIEDHMPGASFFPDAKLNFAENLLRSSNNTDAIVFRSEDKVEKRMSRSELSDLVSRVQQWLIRMGIKEGDRVAAILPNMPESIAMMLATASIGAIWSSCSPDFGPRGVLDRFGQITPKILISCDGYYYNGKTVSLSEKLSEIVPQLSSIVGVLILPLIGKDDEVARAIPNAITLSRALSDFSATRIKFNRLPFNHPLFILFSSGTTGVPKCIVHGAGGTLLQHLKEHQLHSNIAEGDRVFYFTTLGWMMWNWLASALASGATLILYDGSPFAPTNEVLFDFAESERVSFFGTSAKYLDACKKENLSPKHSHRLQSMKTIASTGSPLAAETFEWVYHAISDTVHLASISGGTDIVSCFVLGDPTSPVYAGEIQRPGLGMEVDVWDDEGHSLVSGKGELVCTKAFPSMPIGFWDDVAGSKYRTAYFDRFPGVWCHGDFAEWTQHGGMIIHGRSDATLNPGGVRIGTAEIYAQVEQIPEVLESIAIGQNFQNDVRIILFVRLRDGIVLDQALEQSIRSKIRVGASPRHVPAKIVAVGDIPRTKSGKITELAVRDIVHGNEVKNREALANPEALELFQNLPQLKL